ncbi:MAG: phosphatase PAP2 family protein [Dehalococcoidia bacterium]
MALELGVRSRRIIDAVSRRRVYRDVFEIGIVAVAFLLYFLVRGSVVDRDDEALRNALDVIRVEKALGFFWEPQLNEAVIGYGALIQFFNAVYFWMDFPLIVVLALWMYFFGHRHEYTIARDALLASGAIALVVYHLYPVTPPRLLPPEYAFVDTLDQYTHISYQAQSLQPFVNPYAAMPSLHYGWAVLVGGVLFWTTRNVWLRALAVSLPIGQFTSILFTANHYILDAMGGLVVALMGLLIALALQRWAYPGLRRAVRRVEAGGEPAPAARNARSTKTRG